MLPKTKLGRAMFQKLKVYAERPASPPGAEAAGADAPAQSTKSAAKSAAAKKSK